MNQTRKYNRFLVVCSGEDEFIIKKCSLKIQKRFELIGFCVVFIFFECFLSATFFTYSLFENSHWVSLPMGIIWGAIVANIYLLLLYTISPALLPVATKNKKTIHKSVLNSNFISLSMFLRLGFMLFLAFIIAQPFNVCLLSSNIDESLNQHKIIEKSKMFVVANKLLIKDEMTALKDFNFKVENRLNQENLLFVKNKILLIENKIINDNLFLKQTSKTLLKIKNIDNKTFINSKDKNSKFKFVSILDDLLYNELQSDNNFEKNISTIFINNVNLNSDFQLYKNNLNMIVNEKIDNYIKLDDLMSKSNFYVKTIKLLIAESPLAWLLTILISLSFLFPIFLKYSVRTLSSSFFDVDFENDSEMKRIRKEIVSDENSDFAWLENKIKKLKLNEIITSDYYFQRMLLEHRIILEDYEKCKTIYSEILTKHIERYNKNSNDRLKPYLDKLKTVNLLKYNQINEVIDEELKNEILTKYEFWIDAPFRTKRQSKAKEVSNQEVGLLNLIYGDSKMKDS